MHPVVLLLFCLWEQDSYKLDNKRGPGVSSSGLLKLNYVWRKCLYEVNSDKDICLFSYFSPIMPSGNWWPYSLKCLIFAPILPAPPSLSSPFVIFYTSPCRHQNKNNVRFHMRLEQSFKNAVEIFTLIVRNIIKVIYYSLVHQFLWNRLTTVQKKKFSFVAYQIE